MFTIIHQSSLLKRLGTVSYVPSWSLIRKLHASEPPKDVAAPKQTTRRPRRTGEILSGPVGVDMVSTPDPVSNLRAVKYFIPENESQEEREWRLMRERVDKFNSDFWTENNAKFIREKAAFEDEVTSRGEQVTPETLSVFYKDFLDKAYPRQMAYNRQWWRDNLAMLYPGLKASVRGVMVARRRPTVGMGTKLRGGEGPTGGEKGLKFWEKNVEV
ncbi:hypothetical protein BC936DRAFT_148425 [Jimgerdemannia flammicorona]|uniref:Apoptogenic protein 1, mitochondrial n=1 Tax=Jimgerdemannia flammicorona TaxID=994334 RepID=A0A433D329_9FUNG|nr:hypothetical protein BC936DRAFT_148425 [Jimgerdemannia flammicorona]